MAKPTRTDLMAVIAELQTIIVSVAAVSAICGNDRADRLAPLLRRGFDLCLAARAYDPSNAGEHSRFVETELPR